MGAWVDGGEWGAGAGGAGMDGGGGGWVERCWQGEWGEGHQGRWAAGAWDEVRGWFGRCVV